MKHILILEDDDVYRESLAMRLIGLGRIFQAKNLNEALKIYDSGHLDFAIVDLDLDENLEGLKFLEKTNDLDSVVLSSHEEPEVIQKAFKLGAKSFFNKWDLPDELDYYLKSFLEESIYRVEDYYPTKNEELYKEVSQKIELFMETNLSLLLNGETGVGKSQLAKKLAGSDPFIQVNLSEFGQGTIESELFGHKKGAFTGADQDKIGLFEKANNGILFLDEIGVLSLETQKKLLRVLEEKEFYPVGSFKPIKSDFRLISATCDNLLRLISEGKFREDFYYRISGLELLLTPLRERPEDLEDFIKKSNRESIKKICFSEKALEQMKKNSWNGNFRELKSKIQVLRNSSKGYVHEDDLKKVISEKSKDLELTHEMKTILEEKGLKSFINKFEELAVRWAKETSHGKVNESIRKLNISKSLFYRIESLSSNSS